MSEFADLLERFRRGAELVAVVTTGAAGPELDFVPEPGKWSVRQIVCHLTDTELILACRFRAVIAEENPTLVGVDQEAWARNLDYQKRKFSTALETFRRIRAENFELLKELPEQAYQRTGTHTERGPVTLLDLLRTYAEHTESHARQVRGVRDQYKASRAKA
ncbi:MAG: DinB family protein [Bryobacteraceae bacterium]